MTQYPLMRDDREPESIPKRSRRQLRRFEETCRRSEIYGSSLSGAAENDSDFRPEAPLPARTCGIAINRMPPVGQRLSQVKGMMRFLQVR